MHSLRLDLWTWDYPPEEIVCRDINWYNDSKLDRSKTSRGISWSWTNRVNSSNDDSGTVSEAGHLRFRVARRD